MSDLLLNVAAANAPATLAFGIGPIGGLELTVILVVALLIFGRRLPEVGRSLGKGIVEFKKGVQGITDELDDAAASPKTEPAAPVETRRIEQTAVETPATSPAPLPAEEPASAVQK